LWIDAADGHRRKPHGVARFHVHLVARDDHVAGRQALRGEDVGLLAVLVFDERDERSAVGVVFQTFDRRGHVELEPFEIDDAIALFVAAACHRT